MWLKAFDTREVVKVATSLADELVESVAKRGVGRKKTAQSGIQSELQALLGRVDREVRPLRLGLLRRAKLANTFKWRLLDKGIAPGAVDELTQTLLLHLARKQPGRKA